MTAVGRSGATGLLGIIQRLSRAQSQDEIMTVVSHGVRTLLHADGATFVLRDGDRCYYAEEDAVSPLWKGRRFPMSACISGWCMTNRQSVAIPDIFQDARVPADAYRPTFARSLAMAPVRREEPIGALGAYWSEMRQPQPEELELLEAIADAAALAVLNVQLRQAASPNQRSTEVPVRARKVREPQQKKARGSRSPQAFVERARRSGLRPNSLEAYAFAVICVVVSALVREAIRISGVHGLVTYSTFYPAAALSTVVGGRRAGVIALSLGGFAAYWLFMPPLYSFAPLTLTDLVNLTLYGGSCGLIILIIDRYQRAVLRLRQEDAEHLTLASEQRHRVQNALFTVEAIVRQSLRDLPDRARTINGRIRAGLAEVNLGDRADDRLISLRDLLTAELQPFDLARFTLDGEDENPLAAKTRGVLALAIHELATNALKHGALSVPEGRVTVGWRSVGSQITMLWRETGGPPVQPPRRRGYGSILLHRLIEAGGGAISMDFQPSGFTAEISLMVVQPPGKNRRGN